MQDLIDRLALTLALCLLAAPAPALTGTGSRIVDGDTLYLSDHYACPDYAVRRHGCYVRLWGADTPERGQPGYRRATAYLRRLAHGRRLVCTVRGRSGSRVVASCYLPDGTDLSCALIAAGLARRTHHAGDTYRECE